MTDLTTVGAGLIGVATLWWASSALTGIAGKITKHTSITDKKEN